MCGTFIIDKLAQYIKSETNCAFSRPLIKNILHWIVIKTKSNKFIKSSSKCM